MLQSCFTLMVLTLYHLPQSILAHIYSYDPTYREIFSELVKEVIVYRVNHLFCKSFREEYRMRNGKLHGWYKILSEYGHPFREFMYREGLKHGPARFYLWDAYSSPFIECYFDHGLLHGPYRSYSSNGDLVKELYYQHGRRIQNYLTADF